MGALAGHVLEIREGVSQRPALELVPGKTVDPMSIGRRGAWAIDAGGVLDEHVFIYFDGRALFVQSVDDGAPALCDGRAVPRAWTRIDAPCTVGLGNVTLVFRSLDLEFDDETLANAPPPTKVSAPPPPSPDETSRMPPRRPSDFEVDTVKKVVVPPAPDSSRTQVDPQPFPQVQSSPSARPPARAAQPTLLGPGPPPRLARPDLARPTADEETTHVGRGPSPAPFVAARPAAGRPPTPPVGFPAHSGRAPQPLLPIPAPPPRTPKSAASVPPPRPMLGPEEPDALAYAAPPDEMPPSIVPRASGSAPTLLGDRPMPVATHALHTPAPPSSPTPPHAIVPFGGSFGVAMGNGREASDRAPAPPPWPPPSESDADTTGPKPQPMVGARPNWSVTPAPYALPAPFLAGLGGSGATAKASNASNVSNVSNANAHYAPPAHPPAAYVPPREIKTTASPKVLVGAAQGRGAAGSADATAAIRAPATRWSPARIAALVLLSVAALAIWFFALSSRSDATPGTPDTTNTTRPPTAPPAAPRK